MFSFSKSSLLWLGRSGFGKGMMVIFNHVSQLVIVFEAQFQTLASRICMSGCKRKKLNGKMEKRFTTFKTLIMALNLGLGLSTGIMFCFHLHIGINFAPLQIQRNQINSNKFKLF